MSFFRDGRSIKSLSMWLNWGMMGLRSLPTPWQTRSPKSRRRGEKPFGRQQRRMGSRLLASIGCWQSRKGSTLTIPMRSSALEPRNISRPSSTSAPTSEERFWFTVLHIRGPFKRDGVFRSPGILPKRPSRYVLRQLGKETCSTVSNLFPTYGPTSSIP